MIIDLPPAVSFSKPLTLSQHSLASVAVNCHCLAEDTSSTQPTSSLGAVTMLCYAVFELQMTTG